LYYILSKGEKEGPIYYCFFFLCVENATTYSYTPGSKDGPEHWGELSEKWQKCGTGLAQSPIDISKQSVVEQPNLGPLVKSYWPGRATLKRRHHNIEVMLAISMCQYKTIIYILRIAIIHHTFLAKNFKAI
jgi:carbonic anhydrase